MKIAHISATFPPYRAGTGHVCYHHARQLACLGHELHVFTASLPSAPQLELGTSPLALGGIAPKGHDKGGQFLVHRLSPLVQVGNAPLLPQLLWELCAPSTGSGQGFDVIHLHYPFILGAEMVRMASLLFRIPFVISFHNDLIGDGARAHLFSAYQRLSSLLTVRGASRLCAVSLDHYQASLLCASLNGSPVEVVEVPNGVDSDLFSPTGEADIRERYQIPFDAKLLLFVAALDRAHHFKGLERLLRAFPSLPADSYLLVVGDGDLRATYQQHAEDLGIAERTIFVGAVNHEALPPFYRSADVTVLPSSPPESFGLVLIESLACGTPVVASNIPGVRTVVADGQDGFLVEVGQGRDLEQKIQRILALSATERQEMGQAGRRKVKERYAWEQIGQRLEGIYQQIVARPAMQLVEQKSGI